MPKILEVKIAVKILCDCGHVFLSEDLEAECPYCGKIFQLQLHGKPEEIKTEIKGIKNSL